MQLQVLVVAVGVAMVVVGWVHCGWRLVRVWVRFGGDLVFVFVGFVGVVVSVSVLVRIFSGGG